MSSCLVAVLLASCAGREAEVERFALERSQAVSFEASDGVRLEGRLFGPDDATAGVVLAHMLPADQTSWYAFAERMGAAGYRALTFDFRGYCPGGDAGCSEGKQDPSAIWQDVQGAVDYLRRQGVQRVGLVGASMGGTASLVVAGQPEADIMAVATLSAPAAIEGLVVTPEILQADHGGQALHRRQRRRVSGSRRAALLHGHPATEAGRDLPFERPRHRPADG